MASSWPSTLLAGLARAQDVKQPVIVTHREHLEDPPDLLALFAAAEARGAQRFFTAGPENAFSVLGLGSACEIISETSDPFTEVRERAQALLASADPGALLMGGFAFAAQTRAKRDPAWRAFANARFTLPEMTLVQTHSAVWLTRAAEVRPDDDPEALSWRADTGVLETVSPRRSHPALRTAQQDSEPLPEYEQAAAEVIAAIRRDEAAKVVLARIERLALNDMLSAEPLLRHLRQSHPTCFTFAQGFGPETFLGATPELLVRRRDHEITASAVAGTVARGETPAGSAELARKLRTSPKERAEHAFVVHAIEEALTDLCAELEIPRKPDLMQSGSVQHLHTPIRGRLLKSHHILDLAARIHPTPAVGGTPRSPALDLIRKHERFDRGWYTGPLGWFNASGNGDLVVALRCGLLSPGEVRLFAGAGLVAGSNPQQEAAEVALKLQALRTALETACDG
jgi:isochorismate synthase